MKVVIPAAGLGTRFLPLSRVVPKELFLLGDRPVLHHALDEAARGGLTGAVIVTAPWKRPLFEAYFEAADPPLPIDFSEQPTPDGIGDAVLRAAATTDPPFAVLLPDDVIGGSTHWHDLTNGTAPAVCIRPVPLDQIDRFGIVTPTQIVEKPPLGSTDSNLAILGRYVIDATVLEALENLRTTPRHTELQLTEGLAAVAPTLRLVPFEGEVFDCGTPEAYLEAQARWFSSSAPLRTT